MARHDKKIVAAWRVWAVLMARQIPWQVHEIARADDDDVMKLVEERYCRAGWAHEHSTCVEILTQAYLDINFDQIIDEDAVELAVIEDNAVANTEELLNSLTEMAFDDLMSVRELSDNADDEEALWQVLYNTIDAKMDTITAEVLEQTAFAETEYRERQEDLREMALGADY